MKNTPGNSRTRTITICETAISVALALVLSYLKVKPVASGGSIDLVMIPLVYIAVRRGLPWGIGAGFVFGTLKFFFANGFAFNWQSMVFDYSVAYAFVGFAGLVRNTSPGKYAVGAVIGGLLRFVIHFISGITIYAQWMPEEFLNITMTNTWVYSALYNGTYMIPNIIIAAVLTPFIGKALEKIRYGEA